MAFTTEEVGFDLRDKKDSRERKNTSRMRGALVKKTLRESIGNHLIRLDDGKIEYKGVITKFDKTRVWFINLTGDYEQCRNISEVVEGLTNPDRRNTFQIYSDQKLSQLNFFGGKK